jgi:hypothetical protein
MSKFSYDYHKQSRLDKLTVLPYAENASRESRQATETFQLLPLSKVTITGMAGPIKGRNSAIIIISKVDLINWLSLPCAENVPREFRQAIEILESLSLTKLTIAGMAGPIKGRNLATFVMSKARTRKFIELTLLRDIRQSS